ncbi:MAG TPA: GTPase HflX [Acidobacteriota bacterium]|nr:GTPase HflX [Acidobacteriota bacterium]
MLQGLQASQKRGLERTFRRRVPPEKVVSGELARHLAELSRELGRQIGVLLARNGAVRHVIVGDAHKLMLPDIGRLRGGTGRFRGLRLVHTHLRGEALSDDDLNDLALLQLDMVAMIEAQADGLPGRVEAAYLDPAALAAPGDGEPLGDPFVHQHARNVQSLDLDFAATITALEEEFARVVGRARGPKDAERALVIGSRPQDEHFEETLELVRSSGVVIAGTMRQKRRIHPKTIVGRGKLHELILEAMRRNADVAIFDIDLKPAQARAFEDATGMKAIDRTQLILDIFAQRARSRDGKLQVELAQLRYSLPRLTDQDAGLSRLTGGIGGRGPGETVLEIGRRRIRDRIRRLEKQVEQLSKQRDVRRRRRRQQGLPVLSIVGYTNAGKSTLLNALTSSDIETEDRLFMTLDPTSRRLRFPREGEVIITDTVGFIAELPADLVAAFRATLEELVDADLLLHVIDASDARIDDKIDAVNNLLDKLDAQRMPVLKVLNKADLVADDEMAGLVARHDAVAVSATRRSGLENLVAEAESRLAPRHPTAR